MIQGDGWHGKTSIKSRGTESATRKLDGEQRSIPKSRHLHGNHSTQRLYRPDSQNSLTQYNAATHLCRTEQPLTL